MPTPAMPQHARASCLAMPLSGAGMVATAVDKPGNPHLRHAVAGRSAAPVPICARTRLMLMVVEQASARTS